VGVPPFRIGSPYFWAVWPEVGRTDYKIIKFGMTYWLIYDTIQLNKV